MNTLYGRLKVKRFLNLSVLNIENTLLIDKTLKIAIQFPPEIYSLCAPGEKISAKNRV